ncbi:MAG TPA: glycosyltransferase family 39 protein [Gaiellaceae bacterium]|nr:glycosyltransferase family 39 protein [Gaiellaceae bacterium]
MRLFALLRRRNALLVGALLACALLVRVDGITRPSISARELYGGLLARQYYYGDGAGLSAQKREVVRQLGTSFSPIEPPVMNLASAAAFELTGENLWVPRLFSVVFWVIGGVFLYAIAVRLASSGGALVGLALYLFWPFGVSISRRGMPDAPMIALLLAASLCVIRYWERPSPRRLLIAAIVSSFATAAKPGVAGIFLVMLFTALALSQRRLVESVVRGRFPLFVLVASAVSAAYYVYGTYVHHFLAGESDGRIAPHALVEGWYWRGWWSMISTSLPFPQHQRALALVPLAAGAAGIVLARRGIPRAVLVGLSLGYVVLGLVFTLHISTHPYYSLPLVAILSLAIATLAGFLLDRPSAAARGVLVGVFLVAMAGVVYKDSRVVVGENPRQRIADYRRIGDLTGHTPHALVIDPYLKSPISYWGWMVARYWYEPSPAADLGPASAASPLHLPGRFDYLVVMQTSELRTEPRLRELTRSLQVVARTSRYAIFDLRSRRENTAIRTRAGT